MEEDREGIEAHDVLNRVLPGVASRLDLRFLHGPAGVGDVHRAVDHGRDARAGTAAAHRHDHCRIDYLVVLGPRLGHVDQGVRTLVLNHLAALPAPAGDQGCRTRGDGKEFGCAKMGHAPSDHYLRMSQKYLPNVTAM